MFDYSTINNTLFIISTGADGLTDRHINMIILASLVLFLSCFYLCL